MNTSGYDNSDDVMFGIRSERAVVTLLFWSIVQIIFIVYSIYKCSYEIQRTQEEIRAQQQRQQQQQRQTSSLQPHRQPIKSYLFDDQASPEHVKRELIQLFLCHSSDR
jgi:hypothetical protein